MRHQEHAEESPYEDGEKAVNCKLKKKDLGELIQTIDILIGGFQTL